MLLLRVEEAVIPPFFFYVVFFRLHIFVRKASAQLKRLKLIYQFALQSEYVCLLL